MVRFSYCHMKLFLGVVISALFLFVYPPTVNAGYCTGGVTGTAYFPQCPECASSCKNNSAGWYCINTSAATYCNGLNYSTCIATSADSSAKCDKTVARCTWCRWVSDPTPTPTPTPEPDATPTPTAGPTPTPGLPGGKTIINAEVVVYWTDAQGYHEVKSATSFTDWRQR